MEIYLVGGAVRDQLLKRPVKEKDWVVVGGTREKLLAEGYQQVGKDFPVFLHPKTHEEYALARTERKTAKGYRGFECDASQSVTLEEDLLRRDLTINAIAQSEQGDIIDPFNGQSDLNNQILRHVSPAFVEDPVRVLRLARFRATLYPLDFQIADETMALLKTMVNDGEVDALVPERVWKETLKALSSSEKPSLYFETLRECGALEKLFPEINRLWGVPQTPQWHPEIDTGIHTMMALDMSAQLTTDPMVRFATLCHDLGKGTTEPALWPKHHGHESRGVPLVRALCQRLKIPRAYDSLACLVSEYHLHCHRLEELKSKTILSMLEKLRCFKDDTQLKQFILCCEADARGRLGSEDKPYPQAKQLMKLFEVAQPISAQSINVEGLTGEAIGAAIREARVKAMKAVQAK